MHELALVHQLRVGVVDRRSQNGPVAFQQAVFSLLLAVVASDADPSKVALVLVALGIGIGNALYAPTFSAMQTTNRMP